MVNCTVPTIKSSLHSVFIDAFLFGLEGHWQISSFNFEFTFGLVIPFLLIHGRIMKESLQ